MSWLHLPSVTATQGSITVTVNNAFETEHIQIGDALLIGQFAPVEIVGIHSRQLTLRDAWPNATQTAQAGAVIPTAADFQLAASLLRDATTVTQGNFAAMEKWWTENADVTFTAYDGSKHSVPSAQKMQGIMSAKGTSPYEHQYNKIRNVLRNLYDASGIVHWGKHGSDPINEGLYTGTSTPNTLMWGGGAHGNSETAYPVLNIAGHEIHVRGINHHDPNTNRLVFPAAEDGTRTVNTSTGAVTQHADVATAFSAAAAADVEVITRRVDLKYGEVFVEVDPNEILPYGMCKSGLTSVDGIPTTPSSRPDSYHASYTGEVVTNKRCWKTADLTPDQLKKLMTNPFHNLRYNEDGILTQTRYRDCTARGAGNGDFESISIRDSGWARFNVSHYLAAQGMRDAPVGYVSSGFPRLAAIGSGQMEIAEKGIYQAVESGGVGDTTAGYKGECYVLVICTVPRLNAGMASHINEFGTKKASDSKMWHKTSISFSSLVDCFNPAKLLTASGKVGTSSGRQDGLFHNAINADGLNGIIDHRQPANSPQDSWTGILQEFYSAKTRGVQKLPFTVSVSQAAANQYPNSQAVHLPAGTTGRLNVEPGDVVSVVDGVTGSVIIKEAMISSAGTDSVNGVDFVNWNHGKDSSQTYQRVKGVVYHTVITTKMDTSVSGAFSCTSIIATPQNLHAQMSFKEGWLGYWMGLHDGSTIYRDIGLVRKCLLTSGDMIYSDDNSSYASTSMNYDNTRNSRDATSAPQSTRTSIFHIKAYAYQVEDSSNIRVVDGEDGCGRIFAKQYHLAALGSLTVEGFIHKVVTNDNSKNAYSDGLSILKANLHSTGKLSTGSPERYPLHQPLDLMAPTNESPACKALPFLVEKDGYLHAAWQVNELKWSSPVFTTITMSANANHPKGTLVFISDGLFHGSYVTEVSSFGGSTFQSYADSGSMYIGYGGSIYGASGELAYRKVSKLSWGDDSRIKVTTSGWDTFVDLNGNKMTCRSVISTFPIGPAKRTT